MDKLKALAEIDRICKEAGFHYVVFENGKTMREMMEDMRLGAGMRAAYKTLGLPMLKEHLA